MKRAAFALALVLLLPPVCGAQPGPPRGMTPATYRAELQRLLAAIAAPGEGTASPATMAPLPPAWRVEARGREVVVSTDWLRRDLRALQQKPDAGIRARTEGRLRRMLSDLDAYEAASPDASRERRLLTTILARREFSAVRGPTWLDRLKQRISEILLGLVGRIFGSSRFPVVAETVVFVLIGLAVVVTALWIYRTLAGGQTPNIVPEVAVSAKAWTLWLREAREAAAGSNWREAVRLAYWAGISCLESQGVWPPDRARTPREYLKLLPAASQHRPALSALTRTFEPVWYGYRDADGRTFGDTVGELEKLGCR